MKKYLNILMAFIAVGAFFRNLYFGILTNFSDGYFTIIAFFLFSVLFLSKFTKYPL